MADGGAVKRDLEALRSAMAVPRVDTGKCAKMISKLKIALTSLDGLSPTRQGTRESLNDVSLARDVYEQAALFSIMDEDTDAFERHVSQAKTYYMDYADVLKPTPCQNLVLALNLMRLLAQNRIAEFHTELELVSPEARASEVIQYVLGLEQHLMEGSYAKITGGGDPPHPSFEFFLAQLMCTVRDEIAACSERAYKQIKVPVAMELLSLSTEAQMRQLVESRGWLIEGDEIHFGDLKEPAPSMEQVPSVDLIKKALNYAQNLEQIV